MFNNIKSLLLAIAIVVGIYAAIIVIPVLIFLGLSAGFVYILYREIKAERQKED